MKKLITLTLALIMLIGIVGCTTQSPEKNDDNTISSPPVTTTSDVEKSEPVKIRVASHNAVLEGNSLRMQQETDIQDACAAAAEFGFDVSYNSFVANSDPSLESQMLEQSVNNGYDIIVVNPIAPTGLDPVIDKAVAAGIHWINYDSEYYSDKIINVVMDQYQIAYECGKFIGETLGEGAKIVVFHAIAGNSANMRREEGFADAIEDYKLEVVKTLYHDWSPTTAQQLMSEVINSGIEFDAILTSNCAYYVLNAFDEAGVAYPKAIAFDDNIAYSQKMLELNKDKLVLPYLYICNSPGVGATGVNIALNQIAGHTLKDGIFNVPEYNTIMLAPRDMFTYENQEDYRDYIMSLDVNQRATFWLTMDEVRDAYFVD